MICMFCYRALLRVAFRLMRFVLLAMVVLCPADLLISWLELYLISFTLFVVGGLSVWGFDAVVVLVDDCDFGCGFCGLISLVDFSVVFCVYFGWWFGWRVFRVWWLYCIDYCLWLVNLVLLFGLVVGCVALLVCFELRLLLWWVG